MNFLYFCLHFLNRVPFFTERYLCDTLLYMYVSQTCLYFLFFFKNIWNISFPRSYYFNYGILLRLLLWLLFFVYNFFWKLILKYVFKHRKMTLKMYNFGTNAVGLMISRLIELIDKNECRYKNNWTRMFIFSLLHPLNGLCLKY